MKKIVLAQMIGLLFFAQPTLALPAAQKPSEPPILTLPQAITLAIAHNSSLKTSFNNRAAQRYDLQVALDAFHLQPSLIGTTAYQQTLGDGAGVNWANTLGPKLYFATPIGTTLTTTYGYTPSGLSKNSSNSTNEWNITITQPLLAGFGTTADAPTTLSNEKDQQLIDDLTLKASIQSTIATTISDYYSVIQAEKNLTIAKATLQERVNSLNNRTALFQAGRIPGLDVTQIKLDVSEQKNSVQIANLQLSSSKRQLLSVDIGLPDEASFVIPAALAATQFQPKSLDDSLHYALAHNLALQISEIEGRQASRSLENVHNDNRWALNLTASRGYTGPTSASNSQLDSSIGLALNIPLDRTTFNANEFKAATTLDNSHITQAQIRRNLKSKLETALESLSTAWESVQLSEENLALAKINTKAAEMQFQYGKITAFLLSVEETDLQNQQLNLVSAQIAYLNSIVAYQALMGNLLDEWHVQWVSA